MAGLSAQLQARARKRGFRMTLQRQIILDAIESLQGHITAEGVAARVRERYPGLDPQINLSTIYRTLEFLEELDLVRHTHFDDGVARWHGAGEAPHQHLVCRRCGWEHDLDLAILEPLDGELRRRYGFGADLAHFALVGVCADCQRSPERGSGADGEAANGGMDDR
jgi:Fur family ferric uptake transcriptional regulator